MKRWNHNKILWDSHNFHHGILLNCCTLLLAVVVSFSLCLICKQNFNIREKIVLHSKVLFYPCFQASTGHLLREGPYIRRSYCLRTRNLSPQNLFICVSLCSGITRWSLFFFLHLSKLSSLFCHWNPWFLLHLVGRTGKSIFISTFWKQKKHCNILSFKA